MWSLLQADGEGKEADNYKKTNKKNCSKNTTRKESGANMDSVQMLDNLDPRQQQILQNAAEELITQQFLQPQAQQQQQQQLRQQQSLEPQQQLQRQLLRQQQQVQRQQLQQQHRPLQQTPQQLQQPQRQHLQHQTRFEQPRQPHQRRHQAGATSSGSQEDRMHGINPGSWLLECMEATGGEDVELGANVEVESSSVHEDMDVDQSSGAPSLITLELPGFLQQLGSDDSGAQGGQSDQFPTTFSGESIWEAIGDVSSFLSSHSSEEQRVSLGTVLDVLGINQESGTEEQPSSPSQIVPNQALQQQEQVPDASMVLSNRVMWAPPVEAQAYVNQQESIVNPPLPFPASADIPVPQAVSALPQQAYSVHAVTSPVSPTFITNPTNTGSSTHDSSEMSTQDSPQATSSAACAASEATVQSPKLPEYHELVVRGYYRSQELFRTSVPSERGCVLHYGQPQKCAEEDLTDVTLATYPEIPEDTPDKHAQYTKKVLDAVEKGVRIRCVNGYIFATRRCRSKVFVCTSQDMKGDSKELVRDQETVVFNPYLFEKRFRKWLLRQTEDVKIPRPPNIVLTFAQRWSWTSHHPLMNCLVYAVVTPMRARTQLAWGPGSNEAVDSLNRDYRSSMLQISSPSQTSSSSGPGSSGMQS